MGKAPIRVRNKGGKMIDYGLKVIFSRDCFVNNGGSYFAARISVF